MNVQTIRIASAPPSPPVSRATATDIRRELEAQASMRDRALSGASQPWDDWQPQDAYNMADKVILSAQTLLATGPDAETTIKGQASDVRTKFKDSVLSLTALPTTPEEARRAAMAALWAGLVAGALDGVIAFAAKSSPAPQPTPSPAPQPSPTQAGSPAPAPAAPANSVGDDIKQDLEKLMQDLGRAATEAAEQLKAAGPKVLQVASLTQKKIGGVAVNQCKQFPAHPNTPLRVYQSYQASLFAMGYGITINDSAITILANQTPGQWP